MNFKLKAAVAAVAMVASMSASAAMTNSASGASSLILTVLDNTNNISATFDLGFDYNTFQAPLVTGLGYTQTWDLAGNADYAAAWSSFLSVANLNSTATNWGVFAGDTSGSGAGSRGLITTFASGSALMTQSQLNTGVSNLENYFAANNALGTHTTAANGASSAISGQAFAESAAYGTGKKINNQGNLIALKGFDTTMDIVNLKYVGTALLANNSVTTYGNQYGNATFGLTSAGVLTYTAPVPEADTYAMLLAGLGLMGFIARRRTAA